jgi:tetratricopeptide (TPR) repeat protein
MFCVDCGTKNPESACYCKQCGRTMEPPELSTAPPAAEPAHAAPSAPPAELSAEQKKERAEALHRSALRLFEHHEYAAAAAACTESLELAPDNVDAHALRSAIHEKHGEIAEAIAEREAVLRLKPDSLDDKEKLEMLRAGVAQVTPRTIVPTREPSTTTLYEGPMSPVVWAVAACLMVLMVVSGTVWWQASQREKRVREPVGMASAPAGVNMTPPVAPAMTSAAPTQAPLQASPGPALPPQTPATAGLQPSYSRVVPPIDPADFGTRAVPPVSVQPPPFGGTTRTQPTGRSGSGETFFTPETGSSGQGGAATTDPGGTKAGAGQAPLGPGRIIIEVAPAGGSPAPANPNRPPTGTGSTAAMDSKTRRAIAQDLQMQGQFAKAAREYTRALEGAGDDSAVIHQKIALCYQRIPDAEKAVSHYNEAIKAFQEQLAAGKSPEAAQQGIRSCEAGIRAIR